MNIYDRRSPALNALVGRLRKTGPTYTVIARKSGLSTATVARLLRGDTKSPHFKTVEFVLQATLGQSLYVSPTKKKGYGG